MPRPLRFLMLAGLLVLAAGTTPAAAQFVQQGAKIPPVAASVSQSAGYSIALSADGMTAVVGMPLYTIGGAAVVLVRSGGTWTAQSAPLVPSTTSSGAGQAVAISGDGNTIAIGGPFDNVSVGAVWIYVRVGGTWIAQGAKLVGAGETGAGQFGFALALSADGNTLAVGAPIDNSNAGGVWVFTRTNGAWSPQGGKLTAAGAAGSAELGYSVALTGDGNVLMAGGPTDNSGAGAVWVFKRSVGSWSSSGAKLVGTGAASAAQQGIAVAITSDGTTAAVGGNADNAAVGATWVFTNTGSAWVQQGAKLVGGNSLPATWQGFPVALSADGNTLVVGGYLDNSGTGAVWHFTRSNGAWTPAGDKLLGSGATQPALFGRSVALSADGHTMLVGGPQDNSYAGVIWYFAQPQPWIVSARDVPGDQGGEVSVRFAASAIDLMPADPIDAYEVWRQVPATAAARARPAGARALRTTVQGTETWYWEYVGSEPARGFAGYSFTAPTLSDSTATSNRRTVFMVDASQPAVGRYWSSAPDSGYSVDNLPPAAPVAAAGIYAAGTTQLFWSPNVESDLAGYRVYRGLSVGFSPSAANLVAQLGTALTHLQDAPGMPYAYKVTALDVHGNESAPATVVPTGTSAVPSPTPRALSLAIAGPNPAGSATSVSFALPADAAVSLAIHDAAGRRVRTLADGAWPAGEHALGWDLRDAAGRPVEPGLYFVRLVTRGEERVRRIAVVR